MNSLLSSTVSVSRYLEMEKSKDQKAIAVFIRERFSERYIQPMRVDKSLKNCFTIIAVSCLMIETLESFFQGWIDTRNKSQIAFCNFSIEILSLILSRGLVKSFINMFAVEFYIKQRLQVVGILGVMEKYLIENLKQ